MGFVTRSVALGLIRDDVRQFLGSALWSLIPTHGLVLALLSPLMRGQLGLNAPGLKARTPGDNLTLN